MPLQIGCKGEKEWVVTEEMTAKQIGSGLADVFSTPMLVALCEFAAVNTVQEFLEEGQGTVGTLVNVRHLAATPVGMKVCAKAELTEIDRRRLVFHIEAFDESEKIAEMEHERFIIDSKKFQDKADAKHAAR